MNNEKSFVLFYSNYCRHCKDFLVKLRDLDYELFNGFKKICVDDNQNIPNTITSVPSIITPTHNQPLTDNAVFIWLDTLADQFINKNKETNKTQENHSGNENIKEISPFIKNEMGGTYSDNFSFLDTEPLAGPLAHNFAFLDTNDQNDNKSENIPISTEPNINADMVGQRNLSQLDFQLERPEMSERGCDSFDQEFDSLKNIRDNDPFINHATQRR